MLLLSLRYLFTLFVAFWIGEANAHVLEGATPRQGMDISGSVLIYILRRNYPYLNIYMILN